MSLIRSRSFRRSFWLRGIRGILNFWIKLERFWQLHVCLEIRVWSVIVSLLVIVKLFLILLSISKWIDLSQNHKPSESSCQDWLVPHII